MLTHLSLWACVQVVHLQPMGPGSIVELTSVYDSTKHGAEGPMRPGDRGVLLRRAKSDKEADGRPYLVCAHAFFSLRSCIPCTVSPCTRTLAQYVLPTWKTPWYRICRHGWGHAMGPRGWKHLMCHMCPCVSVCAHVRVRCVPWHVLSLLYCSFAVAVQFCTAQYLATPASCCYMLNEAVAHSRVRTMSAFVLCVYRWQRSVRMDRSAKQSTGTPYAPCGP